MFRATCKGLHCAGCQGGGAGYAIMLLICCAIIASKIGVILGTIAYVIEWLAIRALIIGAITAVLTAATITILHKFVIPGRRTYIILEAPDGDKDIHSQRAIESQTRLDNPAHNQLRGSANLPVLSGPAYIRKENGQLVPASRRDARAARKAAK